MLYTGIILIITRLEVYTEYFLVLSNILLLRIKNTLKELIIIS